MRIRLLAGTVAFATLGLAGCSSGSSAQSPAQVRANAADYAFGQYVQKNGLTRYGDENTLRATADGVCRAFDRGADWISEIKSFLDSGFSAGDAGGFIGASVAAYCPGHEGDLPATPAQ